MVVLGQNRLLCRLRRDREISGGKRFVRERERERVYVVSLKQNEDEFGHLHYSPKRVRLHYSKDIKLRLQTPTSCWRTPSF